MLVTQIWPLTLTSEASQDDDENTFESEKFDFEKAIASKDGNQEEGFDENHELPDLPEDLRELINLDDLKKVIQMEVDEEPEVDYELQKVLCQKIKKKTRNFKLEILLSVKPGNQVRFRKLKF